MRRPSFFYKLFLGNLLLVVVIIGLGGLVLYRTLNATHRRTLQRHQNQATEIVRHHFQNTTPLDRSTVQPYCRQVFGGSEIRLTVIAADGSILGDSHVNPRDMPNQKAAPVDVFAQALNGGAAVRIDIHSSPAGEPIRHLAVPLLDKGAIVGAVRASMPLRNLGQGEQILSQTLLWSGLSAVVAAVALALLISWLWYAPLSQITQAARDIASGDLTKRAAVTGSDELASLGLALNSMRDELAKQIDLLADQRENLHTIVANLREGLIGVGRDGRIVFMNPSAATMLAENGDGVEGEYLQSVVRVAGILDTYNQALGGDGAITRQVEVDLKGQPRRVLDLHAARVGNGRQGIHAMIVARDVTAVAKAASMKAQFVANASHELRTPLATIRAAVESIESCANDDPEGLARFLDILRRHVLRLEDMTNDLLDLHKVETAGYRLRRETLSLEALAQWMEDHYGERAARRGLRLEVSTNQPGFKLKTDRALLQLILQNLLDNAIKFTPEGGTVSCRLEAREDRMVATVEDTGCGIAPESQSRVFERFFQVDPARTGDTRQRGTGLGLAIVRHAADRLDAELSLDSVEGEGTTITVSIPA
jgi:two-component system phosphate regulon sensor histidine kinase PhoR